MGIKIIILRNGTPWRIVLHKIWFEKAKVNTENVEIKPLTSANSLPYIPNVARKNKHKSGIE